MAEKRETGTRIPVTPEKAFLGLLTWVSVYGACTFSIYTSRKGRVWLSCKTWGDVPYSTSVELDTMSTTQDVMGAGLIALTHHLPKMTGKHERVDTWTSIPYERDLATRALKDAQQWTFDLDAGKALADLDTGEVTGSAMVPLNQV